jgi:hypothetical protein
MMDITPQNIRGSIDEMILNEKEIYEGNLIKYFQTIFTQAKNVNHPYHNFRHMMHVTWLCYNSCFFYTERLDKRDRRNLLVAALFHDFDHSGSTGPDIKNIELALKGFKAHILPEDVPFHNEIETIIQATEYPYRDESTALALCCQIIRDADLSQSLTPAWLQQVIFGLSAEWKKTPVEVLKSQPNFHNNLKFCTEWARKTWPQDQINKKIEETTNLIKIIEMDSE